MRLSVQINPRQKETLQRQIVEQVIALIGRGVLPPGMEVPSSRALSEQLRVSRNTVKEAYEELIDQGYLFTQRAVGTFVSNELPETFINARLIQPEAHQSPSAPLPLPYSSRGQTGLHSTSPRVLTDFAVGRVDRRSFPDKIWRRLTMECLGGAAAGMSEYADPCGSIHLRTLIADGLRSTRAMAVDPRQVIVVAGCQQGLSLAAHLLVGVGTPIAVEAPCYRGAAFLFESYGAKIALVPVDEHGIQTNKLPTTATKFIYVTPSHQSPTGVTLALDRRVELLEWAAKIGSYVLEVDYDSDFRYDGSPLPSLSALDRHETVIYTSSFSNSIGPGLRLGYVVVPSSLVEAASKVKALLDNGSPWLEQATLAAFIDGGHLEQHVRRVRQLALGRRDMLVRSLLGAFGPAEISGRESGTHVMWKIPEDLPSASDMRMMAASAGVGVYSLDHSHACYFDDLPAYDRMLLLGYNSVTEEEIESGIARLAGAVAYSEPSVSASMAQIDNPDAPAFVQRI